MNPSCTSGSLSFLVRSHMRHTWAVASAETGLETVSAHVDGNFPITSGGDVCCYPPNATLQTICKDLEAKYASVASKSVVESVGELQSKQDSAESMVPEPTSHMSDTRPGCIRAERIALRRVCKQVISLNTPTYLPDNNPSTTNQRLAGRE